MIFAHPQMFVLLLIIPLLLIVWRWRGRRFSLAVVALRVILITLIVLALADPSLGYTVRDSGVTVILVDQSNSLTPPGRETLRQVAGRLVEQQSGPSDEDEQRMITLWFGEGVISPGDWGNPAVRQAPPEDLRDSLKPEGSDLGRALQIARDAIGSGDGRIVLLSDGYQTSGDALAQAQQSASAGIPVDVVPLDVLHGSEVRISGMQVPRSLRVGEEYDVQIDVERRDLTAGAESVGGVQAILQLWENVPSDQGNERLLAEEQVELVPGNNSFTFPSRASENGIVRLRAQLIGLSSDTFAQNNQAFATTVVALQPRVLLVEGRAGNAQDLSAALWRSGVESDILPAEDLPSRLSELQWYEGMVLVDVSAYALSLDQMTTVREFVRSEGRGLVVTGGQNGFSLGGYEDTPLEDVLPVSLEPPPRPQRSDVALLLMLDRSASMSIPVEVSKFDMAKEAAILSTETLQSEDQIGVLAFDTAYDWTVPFQHIGEGLTLEQIQDAIVSLNVGGGTDIYAALEQGILKMVQQQASVRHAVLLTDGRSFTNDMNAYQQVVGLARDNNITLSTIAIGMDSDTQLLDELARIGGGRYYYADKAEDIPRLTLQESEIARADAVVEGMMYAELASPHPLVRGFSLADFPALEGYVATTEREGAEVILHAPGSNPSQKDPLLAAWQYGLGRVVAWTPSVGSPWANSWPEWGEYGPFWAQVVRYTLPKPDSGQIQVHLEPHEEGARLVVEAFETGGTPMNLADAGARITLPDDSQQDVLLQQVAPGRYVRNLLLPIDGAYAVDVVLEHEGERYQAAMGYAHRASAEYTPAPRYRPTSGGDESPQGRPLLARIAEITGGEVLEENVQVATDETATTDETAATDEAAEPTMLDAYLELLGSRIWPWLVIAALVVWVLEIAVRRRGGHLA